jgi:hypothetical protein
VGGAVERKSVMPDFLYVLITLIFFYIGAAFTRGCDRLYKEESND